MQGRFWLGQRQSFGSLIKYGGKTCQWNIGAEESEELREAADKSS